MVSGLNLQKRYVAHYGLKEMNRLTFKRAFYNIFSKWNSSEIPSKKESVNFIVTKYLIGRQPDSDWKHYYLSHKQHLIHINHHAIPAHLTWMQNKPFAFCKGDYFVWIFGKWNETIHQSFSFQFVQQHWLRLWEERTINDEYFELYVSKFRIWCFFNNGSQRRIVKFGQNSFLLEKRSLNKIKCLWNQNQRWSWWIIE